MKKLTRIFFAVFIFLLVAPSAFSQDAKGLFKEGDRLFKLEHYRKALPFLEKVVEAEPNNAEALFETGVCYLHRYSKEKGLQYLLKAYSIDPDVSKYIHYWLGRAYHQNYNYDKAIEEYNIYKESLSKNDERRKDLEKHIEQTNTARQNTQNPENYRVANLGPVINTIYSEHSPVTAKNDSGLLFTSRRHEGTGGKEDLDGEFFEDIFQTKQLPSGEWSTPEQIHLNTSGHDASIQLFDNDTKLLVYRESKGGDIYVTEKEPGSDKWKDPKKFANINTPDYEADAFITADGKTAYFATNHYKKIGDLDIYYITKNDDGSWSKPKELEGKINTAEDEDAPYLTPDGKTLYFSSRGHKNMGGFDVFKSTLDTTTGRWSTPQNLGYPINTPDDDVYYYMTSNGRKGYLSSYREGGYGEKDIYEITPIPPAIIVCKLNPCEGKQREPMTYVIQSLKKTTKAVNVSGKVQNDKIEARVMAYNSYRLALFTGKDTVYSETFEIPFTETENSVIEKYITLSCPEKQKDTTAKDSVVAVAKDTVKSKDPVAAKDSVVAREYNFKTIYFLSGQSTLTTEARKELQKAADALKKNPKIQLEVGGHADAVGNDELNQTLSDKRAQNTADYLISKGVEKERVTAKGYGESNPVGDNETEKGRKQNRRVEFKILSK